MLLVVGDRARESSSFTFFFVPRVKRHWRRGLENPVLLLFFSSPCQKALADVSEQISREGNGGRRGRWAQEAGLLFTIFEPPLEDGCGWEGGSIELTK